MTKPSLLLLQQKPEMLQALTEADFESSWKELAKLRSDLDLLDGKFIQEYVRRVAAKQK